MDQILILEVETFLAIFATLTTATLMWVIRSVSAAVKRDELDRRLAKLERDIDKLANYVKGNY